MSGDMIGYIVIFVLAAYLGVSLIGRVPPTLHTPLMSGTNAVSGIIIVGAILVAGVKDSLLMDILGFLAVMLAAMLVFGGYVVTDRMLEMFKKKPEGEK